MNENIRIRESSESNKDNKEAENDVIGWKEAFIRTFLANH